MVINNKTSEKFANYMMRYPKFYKNLAKIAKNNIINSIKKPVIIDIGTGPGLLNLELINSIPNAKVIGLDPSFEMLKWANKIKIENIDKIELIQTKVENIPLKNNSSDLAIVRFSFVYWDKPKDGLLEIYRILKPGKRLILEVINRDYPKYFLIIKKIHMFFKSAGNEVIKYHIDSYKNAYRISQVENLVYNAGFNIIIKEGKKVDWKFLVIAEKPL